MKFSEVYNFIVRGIDKNVFDYCANMTEEQRKTFRDYEPMVQRMILFTDGHLDYKLYRWYIGGWFSGGNSVEKLEEVKEFFSDKAATQTFSHSYHDALISNAIYFKNIADVEYNRLTESNPIFSSHYIDEDARSTIDAAIRKSVEEKFWKEMKKVINKIVSVAITRSLEVAKKGGWQ